MAQGDVLLNDDGTVALDGAGLVRLVDVDSDCPDCCDSCTASATSCANCTDVTPAEYDVTFSGVTLCTPACAGSGAYGFQWAPTYSNATLNTKHRLTQVSPGACIWSTSLPLGAIEAGTNIDACGGSSSDFFISVATNIRLEKTSTGWVLEVEAHDGSELSPFGILFRDEQPHVAAGVCAELPGFDNDADTCGEDVVPFKDAIATGGSATVVCV